MDTPHSSLIFENQKPVEKSKNRFKNIISTSSKVVFTAKARFSCSPILKICPALLQEHIPCEQTQTVWFIGKVQENWPNLL